MQAITLEVILRAVFGVTDDEPAGPARARCLRGLLDATASPTLQLAVAALAPARPHRPAASARGRPRRDRRDPRRGDRRAPRDPDAGRARRHPLACWSARRFEDGEPMSDAELRDQLITLLLAGHETTATALAWTFDLLLRHPEALRAARGELDAGDGDEYLRAVIAESLRLRPVVPLAGRRLAARAARRRVRAARPAPTSRPRSGSPTRAPTSTREPLAFRPERFLDDAARDLRLGPVRRRRAPLPRRGVRRVRDARRARRRPAPRATLAPAGPARERAGAAQRHAGAAPRGPHPGARRRVAAQLTGSEPFAMPSAASSNADDRRSLTDRSVASDWKNRPAKPGRSASSA